MRTEISKKFIADERVRKVRELFGLKGSYKFGEFSESFICPVCKHQSLGLIVNKNYSIGLFCTKNKCRPADILHAVGLQNSDLTGMEYRKPKPRKSLHKNLVAPGHLKAACISNPFVSGGRFENRRRPPPSPNILKIFLLLAAQAHARVDRAFSTYVTTPRELWHALGYTTPPTYDELSRFIIDALQFVTGVQQKDGKFIGVRWFADETHADFREGRIYLRLHDACRPYLLQLASNYSKVRPRSAFRMRSAYAILLYMVLCRYAGRGWWRDEHFVPVADLLRALMVPLLSKTARNFWLFEANILRRAKQEIEESSELRFSYSVVRVGGKVRGDVVGIRFFNIKTVEINETTGREKKTRTELERQREALDHPGRLERPTIPEVCFSLDENGEPW